MKVIRDCRITEFSVLQRDRRAPARAASLALLRAIALAIAFWCAGPSATQAQNTWLGTSGTTGNWSDPTKWSSGTVPDGSTAITIPTGTVQDNFSFTNQFQLVINATGDLNVLSTTTIANDGGQINNAGVLNNHGTLSSGDSQLNNLSGGVWNNSGSITSFDFGNATSATLNNSGTFVGTAKALVNEGTINNTGSMLLPGTLNLGTFSNSGTLTFDTGSTMFPAEAENSATFTNLATGTINNTGSFVNDAGATFTNMGTIVNSGLIQNLGTFNNSSTMNGVGPEFVNTLGATLNNTGAITIKSGETFLNFASALNNSASGQFTNNGTLDDYKGGTTSNAGTFTNNGTLDNGFDTFTNSGVLNNTGRLMNESVIQITSGGVLNNSGTFQNALNDGVAGSFTVMNGGTFNNSNLFVSDSNSAFTMAAGSTVVNTNLGTMELSSPTPTVVVGGNLRNDGSIILVAPPTMGIISFPPPTLVIASTGAMSGTGLVNGSITVQGTMKPGDSLGTMTVNGLYQQMAGSTLDILLGGANAGQFSQLVVNGDAVLGGTLDVELFGSFDPTSGEIFEILSGKISGSFADILLPTLDNGLFFSFDQEANGVFIDVLGTETGGGGGNNVPEPPSVLLLAAGLCAMFGLMRGDRARRGLCRQ
jgi:subtilase-type serine protease